MLAAFEGLGDGFDAISGQVRELATLTRSSPVLSAWTLQIYLRYEEAIAALVAPRLGDPAPEDPRPRLLGALAMASTRIALDDWLLHGGSLPVRVRTVDTDSIQGDSSFDLTLSDWRAAVPFSDLSAQYQTNARASGLRGEEGHEEIGGAREARPFILHPDFQHGPIAAPAHPQPRSARCQ